MSGQDKIGSHKTKVFTDDEGYTNVVYHETAVVKFNAEKIILNSGGWRTNTTKLRMNQASIHCLMFSDRMTSSMMTAV